MMARPPFASRQRLVFSAHRTRSPSALTCTSCRNRPLAGGPAYSWTTQPLRAHANAMRAQLENPLPIERIRRPTRRPLLYHRRLGGSAVEKARNDLSAAVPKFCLALEEHRRTPDGRVRTSQELLATFFPHDEKVCTDKIFKYLPNEVRGPIIAAWGIRGIKAALRDDDERIQQVVYDALVAGDVDHSAFEEGLTPETLVRWVPLGDLWSFWRGGKLTKQAIHK